MPPFVARKRRRSSTPPPPKDNTKNSKPSKQSTRKPSVFDTIDAKPTSRPSLEDNQAFLESLQASSSESSLSEFDSSDFEDVNPPKRLKKNLIEHESDEEAIDWEDAIGPDLSAPITHGPDPSGDLDLTLDKTKRFGSLTNPHNAKKGPSKIERQIRVRTHCMHVQYLLFHNLVRNIWISDKSVQHELVNSLPPGIVNELKKWKSASGIIEKKEGASNALNKSNGRGRNTKSAGSKISSPGNKRQRDWGTAAERLEVGVPDLSRGDPTVPFLRVLCKWWRRRFGITAPGLRKQGYKPLEVLEAEILSFQNDSHNAEIHGERIADKESFIKLARAQEGSRDVGAQLFTSLLRGLGFDARLVCSLQPVGFGWSKAEEANLRQKSAGGQISDSSKTRLDPGGASDSENEDDQIKELPLNSQTNHPKSRGRAKANPKAKNAKGRGAKETPITLSDSDRAEDSQDDSLLEITKETGRSASKSYDNDLPVPIYWTEVLSPVTNQYIPVDAMISTFAVGTAEHIFSFEPRGSKAEKSKQVMAYVVAFSSDSTAKDVTTRYLKRRIWPGKTKGFRIPIEKVPVYDSRGKIKRHKEYDWFKTVMSGYARDAKGRTAVDDLEESTDLLPAKPQKEGNGAKEDTLQGYKTSADFVLERHLRREEALQPNAKHVKNFITGKGDKQQEEKVFLRKDVLTCKTSESWHKEGREVKAGEQPLKLVPMRAVTLTRKREVAEAEAEGGKAMQGLYSKDQTDWIIPPPIVDGKIPRNAYNNIDCFVPTMVPQGAIHLPYRGMAKICKRLDIDFAEAVVGFEFGNQRAVPVVRGVVIAEENEDVVMDAWEIDEEERRKKEEGKREKEALALWRKLLMGLRIIERVRQDYGGDENEPGVDEMNPFTNRRKKSPNRLINGKTSSKLLIQQEPKIEYLAGGFIRDEDDQAKGEALVVEDERQPSLQHLRSSPNLESSNFGELDDSKGDKDSSSATNLPFKSSKLTRVTRKSSDKLQVITPPDSVSYKSVAASESKHQAASKLRKKHERAAPSDLSSPSSESDLVSGAEAKTKEGRRGRKGRKGRKAKKDSNNEALSKAIARAAPRRKAAEKSQTALRSHYFDEIRNEEEPDGDPELVRSFEKRNKSMKRKRTL